MLPVIAGVLLLALPTTALLCFFPISSDLCANTDLRESISPNGALKTVLFVRDCGATTSYSTQVSILPVSDHLPNEAGNVFILGDKSAVVVRWIDDRHINISSDGAATIFKRLTNFNGIMVTFDQWPL